MFLNTSRFDIGCISRRHDADICYRYLSAFSLYYIEHRAHLRTTHAMPNGSTGARRTSRTQHQFKHIAQLGVLSFSGFPSGGSDAHRARATTTLAYRTARGTQMTSRARAWARCPHFWDSFCNNVINIKGRFNDAAIHSLRGLFCVDTEGLCWTDSMCAC